MQPDTASMTPDEFTPAQAGGMTLQHLLAYALKNRASDLHLRVDEPPLLRIKGDIRRIDIPSIPHGENIEALLADLLDREALDRFRRGEQSRFLADTDDFGVFHIQLGTLENQFAATLSWRPSHALSLDDLQAPDALREIADIPAGLALINGRMGSGCMTTVAALRLEMLERPHCHVVSIGSGNFVRQSGRKSMHSSILVGPGLDAASYDEAIERASYLDADYIFILDSLNTLSTAAVRRVLDLARGHCVVASVTATSTSEALFQLLWLLDHADREIALRQVADVLRASVCQRLFRQPDKSTRIACHEILWVTPQLRPAIAGFDLDKIAGVLASHGKSISMKRAAKALLERGLIDSETFNEV